MRRMRDAEGAEWEVVVSRSSWGLYEALFLPVGTSGTPAGGAGRTMHLGAESQLAAERELAGLTHEELAELLAASRPRDE